MYQVLLCRKKPIQTNVEELMMRRRKPDARLVCYASIIALSLNACTQHGSKTGNGVHLTDNPESASTSDLQNSQQLRFGQAGHWFRKKTKTAGTGQGKNSSHYDNLWDRLFDLYDLPPVEHQDVDRELSWFLNHPDYIDRVQKRAEPFLYSIVSHVEKQNVPGEIALLPVIESAFQPRAVSPANAAGIWQFIPSTGRRYGLKQNRSYDGRRDVYASTKAAVKYLKKLHSDFKGDWLLAIAAYNCGEGAVGRAIQKNLARNLPTDFWSLDLPEETRSYVPRLLAVARLFSEAGHYGIDLRQIPNAAMFKPVKVSTPLDLALAADATDMSLDQFYELNPGFKHQIADVDGSYRLFIPAEKTKEFKRELARLAQESRMTAERPRALDGETRESGSGRVAETASPRVTARVAEWQVPPASLQPVSFQRERREASREPVATVSDSGATAGKTAAPRMVEANRDDRVVSLATLEDRTLDRATKKTAYRVQAGDTLWSIARKHAVDPFQLAKWNDISPRTNVKTGQTLTVWGREAGKKLTLASSGIRSSQSIHYTVRHGDTLFSISRRFNVSVADLRKWNGSRIERQMQPGRNITVQVERD
jgi:membrane-bound lytic murein transglycosylase D